MAGNGPVPTSPVYASDEKVLIRCRGDYANLSTSSEQLAYGNDGVITTGFPWTLTSASVDFQGQGVTAQNVILLSATNQYFPGGGRMFAVDSVSPNTVNLRTVGQDLGVGQPPVPPSIGLTNVTFTINTFASLIEDASYDLKARFAIDEATSFRASNWVYDGVEDEWRDLRAACVLQVLMKAYMAEARTKDGDFWQKFNVVKADYGSVLDRLQIRWGPTGISEEPTTLFSCKVSR